MVDVLRYKTQIAWRTFVKNVLLFSPKTETDKAIYTLTVEPIDINELGAQTADKQIGYNLVDYIGNVFKIVEININGDSKRIKVSDDFDFGQSPQSGQQGIVYKSAYGGLAPYVAPIFSKHLSRTALDKVRSIETSILWQTREKIEFENTNTPSIVDYQENFSFIYGEFPDVTLITYDSEGVEWEMLQVPVRNYIDNKLDSIVYDLPDGVSGYIILSR